MSEPGKLFSDFKESFTLSEYFIVDANGCPYEGNQEPEAQLENLPKRVIITQVWSVLQTMLANGLRVGQQANSSPRLTSNLTGRKSWNEIHLLASKISLILF